MKETTVHFLLAAMVIFAAVLSIAAYTPDQGPNGYAAYNVGSSVESAAGDTTDGLGGGAAVAIVDATASAQVVKFRRIFHSGDIIIN